MHIFSMEANNGILSGTDSRFVYLGYVLQQQNILAASSID